MSFYSDFWHFSAGLFILFIVIAIFAFLIWAGIFLLGAFGLFNIAKRENMKNPWLAFIPVAQLYIMGSMLKKIKVLNFNFEIPKLEILLPLAPVAAWALSYMPVLWIIISLAFVAFMVLCLWDFFKLYKTNDTAMLFTIFSGIFIFFAAFGSRHVLLFTYLGLLAPIFIFTLRNANKIAAAPASAPAVPAAPAQDGNQSNG